MDLIKEIADKRVRKASSGMYNGSSYFACKSNEQNLDAKKIDLNYSPL